MQTQPSRPDPAAAPRGASRGPSLRFLAPLAALLAACGGGGSGSGGPGGGPGGGTGPGGINDGELSVAGFGYDDPHPAGFHPLARGEGEVGDVAQVVRRDETYVFAERGFDGTSGTWPAWRIDDGLSGAEWREDPVTDSVLGTHDVLDVAAGDPDGDGDEELVWVVLSRNHDYLRLRRFEPDGHDLVPGTAVDVAQPTFGAGSAREARLALGDLDGDGKDEMVLAAWGRTTPLSLPTGTLRVLGDFDLGAPLLFETPLRAQGQELFPVRAVFDVVCAQLDDDEPLEIVASGVDGGGVVFYDDLLAGMTQLHAFQPAGILGGGWLPARLVGGDFDGDGRTEVVAWWSTRFLDGVEGTAFLFEDAGQGFRRASLFANGRGLLAGTAADVDGDGKDELACVLHSRVPANPFGSERLHMDFLAGGPSVDVAFDEGALSAGDRDGDLKEEVDFAFGVSSTNLDYGTYALDGHSVRLRNHGSAHYFHSRTPRPVCVTADFDRDGCRLRFTGNKEMHLGPIVPIVLIGAPPTKAGISQNYEDTSASYGISQSSESAYTVETGISMSLSVGVDVEDPFGQFAASAKTSFGISFSRSNTTSSTIEVSRSFLAAYDQDYVVFQGTLYHSYEYEILSAADPSAIGTTVTLDVPVATRVFKWTLGFFNENIAPEERLEPSLLGHVIGDPTSYPTRVEADGILNGRQGHRTASITTPQGSAPNAIGFAVSEAQSQGSQLSFSVTRESEVKVGGATAGASIGLTRDYLWSVTVQDTTAFDCTIGGIRDAAEWSAWNYDTGLLVYTLERPRRPAHHVLHYWTDPLGTAYD